MNLKDPHVPHPIEGVWTPIKGELNSDPVPELVLKNLTFILRAGRYKVLFGEKVCDSGCYKLSSFESPYSSITLYKDNTQTTGPNKSSQTYFHSIYQLRGNRLRICHALDGAIPLDFKTLPGSNRYLITYSRK